MSGSAEPAASPAKPKTSAASGESPIHVVYLVGDGRSGTTLLARLLGELNDFVNLGEAARYLVKKDMRDRKIPCDRCGDPALHCDYWKNVLRDVPVDRISDASSLLRLRHWRALQKAWQRGDLGLANLLTELVEFYRRAARQAGCSVVVDSSKSPTIAYLLSRSQALNVEVIHLVRDPRAVTASWIKPKAYLRAHGLLRVIANWALTNQRASELESLVEGYNMHRYEDMVNEPASLLRQVLQRLGRGSEPLNFLSSGAAMLSPQCPLAGNPEKSVTGRVPISYRPWTLSRAHRIVVTGLLLPWMRRYGY